MLDRWKSFSLHYSLVVFSIVTGALCCASLHVDEKLVWSVQKVSYNGAFEGSKMDAYLGVLQFRRESAGLIAKTLGKTQTVSYDSKECDDHKNTCVKARNAGYTSGALCLLSLCCVVVGNFYALVVEKYCVGVKKSSRIVPLSFTIAAAVFFGISCLCYPILKPDKKDVQTDSEKSMPVLGTDLNVDVELGISWYCAACACIFCVLDSIIIYGLFLSRTSTSKYYSQV